MANSKIGFHLSIGGNKNGLRGWEELANSQGIPFGLKSADEYGVLLEALNVGQQYNVSNWLGFRFTRASGKVSREVPNYPLEPAADAIALAQEVVSKLPAEFDKQVWLELINEPRDENSPDDVMYENMNACDYLGQWCLAAAQWLNARGYKFMGPGFNSGRPGRNGYPLADAVTQYSQPGMLAYLSYCAANPTMAALAVHEYSWSRWLSGETPADWYPQFWGRFEAAIAAADLAGIPRTFKIFVSEFGFDLNKAPTMPQVATFLTERNQMLARWPQVVADASWALQGGWGDVDDNVNTWMQYDIAQSFNEGPQPAQTHSAFGATLPSGQPVNKLFNPSFELGSYTYNNIQEIRVPDGYTFWFAPASLPNPFDPNPWSVWRQPESRLMIAADFPPNEQGLFIKDGNKTWKIFKGNGSIWFYLGQTIPAGRYTLTLGIFPDVVASYVNGVKVFATDPDSCIIWVETPTGTTPEQRPVIGQFNYLTFEFEMLVDGVFKIHVLQPFAVQNNGAFLDDHSLLLEEIMPITVPTKLKHTIHLLPQNTTLLELNQVTTQLHPTRTAFTYSADVCHALMFAGTADSKVVIWDGQRWPGGVPGITKWFNDRGITNLEFRNFGGGSTPNPF